MWTMHLVHDQMAAGRKLYIFIVVATHKRLSPVFDPRLRYCWEDVAAKLVKTSWIAYYPEFIRVDNCSRFVSQDTEVQVY